MDVQRVSNINLKSYLDIYQLLQNDNSPQEERRAFGLSHVLEQGKPVEQLFAWLNEHKTKLRKPLFSQTLSSYFYGVTLTLLVIAFVFGFLSGIALLSYNGHEPVNVVYFMAMVIFFPLVTMILALVSMMRANSFQSTLVHLSPTFWMEKIFQFLPSKIQEDLQNIKINPLLANWIVIKRSQFIALFFALGLFFALLGIVATKDIAFSWSTTLDISPDTFHSFLHTLAFPWRDIAPWAVPSMELIGQSQYFRLGDKLSEEMICNASKLGEWWKFLAFATVFYAIILRFFLYVFSSFGLKKAIKKSLLSLNNVKKLLNDMNEPIISTYSKQNELLFSQRDASYTNIANTLDSSYDIVQGWAISKENLAVLLDSMKVISPKLHEVGGGNTFEEDNEVIALSQGEVLLFVKAWEPPTMDFMDYLELLADKARKIILCPIGTVREKYEVQSKELDIWARKISSFDNKNVWLKR